MAGSLRDQLVKAGLATSLQAKKAERQLEAEQRGARQGKSSGTTQDVSNPATKRKGSHNRSGDAVSVQTKALKRTRELNAAKLERDRKLAAERNEKVAEKALRAQVKQIIIENDLRAKEAREDDVPYNFVHGKKIKKIYVPTGQREQLSAGTLVIVNNDGRYHLVSREIADKLATRNPKCIIAAHDATTPEPGSDDDFYDKFKVPDDLDW